MHSWIPVALKQIARNVFTLKIYVIQNAVNAQQKDNSTMTEHKTVL